jgi:hypothetical protein
MFTRMAAVGAFAGYLLYLFTLIIFFLLLVGAFVGVMELITAPAERRRKALMLGAFIGVGFFAGGAIGWYSVLPSTWTLSFAESVRASVDTVTYTHAVEHVAERLVLFAMLTGDLGAIAGFATALVWQRKHARVSPA